MAWSHFEYTSGANPFIATTDEKRREVIREWEERGALVESVPNPIGGAMRWYVIHDKDRS